MGILGRIFGRKNPADDLPNPTKEEYKEKHSWTQRFRDAQRYKDIKQNQRAEKWERRMVPVRNVVRAMPTSSPINRFVERVAYKRVPVKYNINGKIVTRYENKLRGQQNVNPRIAQAVASVGGGRIPRRYLTQRTGRGGPEEILDKRLGTTRHSGRGRPRGPSGRYFIPGKGPVGVYEYRRWARNQRTMRNLQQSNNYQQQQVQGGYESPQQQMTYDDQVNVQNAPQNYPQAPQQPNSNQMQNNPPFQQNRFGQVPQMNNNGYAQQVEAQTGVKLWDDSFMKLDSGKSNINPNQKTMMQETFDPELPVSNPQGDYYTEPDFFSGKQVLRRRSGDQLFKW